jgi:hypothetical protein
MSDGASPAPTHMSAAKNSKLHTLRVATLGVAPPNHVLVEVRQHADGESSCLPVQTNNRTDLP